MKQIKNMVVIILFIIPSMYIVLLSLFTFFKYPQIMPSRFTLDYWSNLFFENALFYKSIFSSIVIGTSTGIIATVIGFMSGRGIVHHLNIKNKWIGLFISIPLFIPGISLFLGIHQILLKTAFINQISGIVISHLLICIPYTTNIALSYFVNIPEELEHVSKTLGASDTKTFYKVLLPILAPGIVLSFAISFLISNTEYFSTFLMGGGNVVTLSMIMYPYISNNSYGYSSVTGLIFIAINLTVFVLADVIVKKNSYKNTFFGRG